MNFDIEFENQINISIPYYDQPKLLVGINLDDEEMVEKILRRDDSLFDVLRFLINEKRMLSILKIYSLWDTQSILNSYETICCYGSNEEDISCNIKGAQEVINDSIEVINCKYANNQQKYNAQMVFTILKNIVEKKTIAQLKKDLTKKRRSDFDKNRDTLLLLMIEKDGIKCKKCFSIDHITVDHIIPLSKGGSDELDNLQILCRSCNSKKGDR